VKLADFLLIMNFLFFVSFPSLWRELRDLLYVRMTCRSFYVILSIRLRTLALISLSLSFCAPKIGISSVRKRSWLLPDSLNFTSLRLELRELRVLVAFKSS
jgi:hypothetical protein